MKDKKKPIFQGLDLLLTGLPCKKEKEVKRILRRYGGEVLVDIPSPFKKGESHSLQLPVVICTKKVAPYCASKWAIEGLTKSVAKELTCSVAVVALSLGVVHTYMLESCFGNSASKYPTPDECKPRKRNRHIRKKKQVAPFVPSLSQSYNIPTPNMNVNKEYQQQQETESQYSSPIMLMVDNV